MVLTGGEKVEVSKSGLSLKRSPMRGRLGSVLRLA